jgi:hypothetical protein
MSALSAIATDLEKTVKSYHNEAGNVVIINDNGNDHQQAIALCHELLKDLKQLYQQILNTIEQSPYGDCPPNS